jgi:hypothetical protein
MAHDDRIYILTIYAGRTEAPVRDTVASARFGEDNIYKRQVV